MLNEKIETGGKLGQECKMKNKIRNTRWILLRDRLCAAEASLLWSSKALQTATRWLKDSTITPDNERDKSSTYAIHFSDYYRARKGIYEDGKWREGEWERRDNMGRENRWGRQSIRGGYGKENGKDFQEKDTSNNTSCFYPPSCLSRAEEMTQAI